ncbi:MAG: hypothetical protein WBB98_14645 [Xanthobacteraceae bacterium]
MLIKAKFRFHEVVFGILFAIALFALGIVFSSQKPQQAPQNGATAQGTVHVSAPSSADERVADYTLALAWLTGALVVCNLGLWVATGLTLRHTRRTAERQLRAYVHVTHSQLTLANIGYEPNIVVQIKNFGQTPARNIKGKLLFKPLVEPTKESDFSSPEFRLGESPDLAPGQTNFFRTLIDQTNWSFMKPNLAAKKTVLYVFGCITYNDAFTDELRTTEFRYRMLVDDDGITDAMALDPVGHEGNRTS